MIRILCTFIIAMLAVSGCASTDPTKFYLLSPETNPAPVAAVPDRTTLRVVVAPVRFPEYLSRSQIVTRVSENELELGWYDRWAEALDRNFSQVLAENIGQLLNCRCASIHTPRSPSGVTHRVEVDIVRMDGELGQKAFLDVWWSIYSGEKKLLLSRRSSLTQPIKGQGYDAFVRAQSKLLFTLSREIATAIAGMSRE